MKHWPKHVDPIQQAKNDEEYLETHSPHLVDTDNVTMTREEMCGNELARQWKQTWFGEAAMYSMIPMLLMR